MHADCHSMAYWTGRVDPEPDSPRWHQRIRALSEDSPPGLALLGFACDEGVRRNYGRVGAAGGLGFAARAFLHAGFRPGIELVAELSGLADAVEGADLVITGEGRLDSQSLHGKTPVGVARIARAAGVPVVALAGNSLPAKVFLLAG